MQKTVATGAAVRTALVVGLVTVLASCGGNGSGPVADGRAASSALTTDPLTVTGRFTASSLGLTRPSGLALAPNGNLYVTDFSQRVTVISSQGRVLARWGMSGSGPGQFRFVAGDPADPQGVSGKVAVGPDGTVYVADSGNGRVEAFTPDGLYLRSFGSFGTQKGQLLSPFDLVVDRAGQVYVADDQRQTLSKFASTGKVLWAIGGSGADPDLVGHFHLSMIDSHGRIVLANDGNARVLYIDETGHKVDAFGGAGVLTKDGPCDVSVDALGYTYVTPCGPGATFVFDRRHRLVARWAVPDGVLYTAPRFGPTGEGFAFGQDGSLLRLRPTVGRP